MQKRWRVPVRVVEHGRHAIVEAETASEARLLAKRGHWEEADDADKYDIYVVGAAVEIDEPL
jgi:hypothetical protein